MAKQHSISEARMNLSSLVTEAESGEAVELTRRGEPVAVLIGRRQYARLRSHRAGFFAAYQTFVREFDLAELSLNPDELFSGVRAESSGREIKLSESADPGR